MEVDPSELTTIAVKLAELARDLGAALPAGGVVPAGSDPISAQLVPQLNNHATALSNGIIAVLNEVLRHAHEIGAAAAEYSTTDDHSAALLGGGGGDLVANPVTLVEALAPWRAQQFTMKGAVGESVDPLTFARQLRAGPGPAAAAQYSGDLRSFLTGSYATAGDGLGVASSVMSNWTPVGETVAENLNRHQSWMDQLGTGLGLLANDIDTYTAAFTAAQAKHPTPEEILAARKKLLAAVRAKDELTAQEALAELGEQTTRSAETAGEYGNAVNTASGSGGSSGGSDMSMLASMLPALMSAMSANGFDLGDNLSDDIDEFGYDDYLDSYPALGGGGGSGGGGLDIGGGEESAPGSVWTPTPLVNAMTTAGATSAMPRASVIEPFTASSSSNSAYGRNGMPMTPYMPMAPGTAGAGTGSNERSRVVAWHPDRLMYVDSTPYTELVIGERPTIAPAVTPPTPGQQASSQSGGIA
ncbi:PPE domain-containing protein [Nocardia sp. NPDC050793]|uniref:PPE domain-containing protein n=1 Tax=Nocardia sp. NPDC050793 TaxID=3155159 RepID=UPI0033F8184D